jgi:hypothetical protein
MDVAILILTAICALGAIVSAVPIMRDYLKNRTGGVTISKNSFRRSCWALGVSIVAFCFSAFGLYRVQPRTIEKPVEKIVYLPAPPRVIQAWGSADGKTCPVTINSISFILERDRYVFAVVCGLVDPTVDKFEDRRITISAPFTIREGPVDIDTPASKIMLDGIAKMKADALKSLPPAIQKHAGIQVQIWFQVILIPKGTNTADIQRLSDVARYGGKIPS